MQTKNRIAIALLVSSTPMVFGCAGGIDAGSEDPPELQSFLGNDPNALRQAEELSLQYLREEKLELAGGLEQASVKRVSVDKLGEAHSRIDQFYDGIPVFGAQSIVHLNPDGSFKAVTDRFVRGINVETTPRVREHEAIEIAVDAVGGSNEITAAPKSELVLVRYEGADHLAYKVQLERLLPGRDPSAPLVFVDAKGGKVFWQIETIETARNRKTYTSGTRTRLPGTLLRTEAQAPVSDAVANQAHDNAGATYDYYSAVHGRDSFDGAGAIITSSVHYDRNYVNAFWNGTQMVYGDGNGVDSGPLTVLDVVGHELTHAVTQFESALIYSNESGALNEALSDIFGASIESYREGAVSANTWKIGEQCWTPAIAGDALRYMNDPEAAGDKDYYPTRYTGTSDNGGVHTNSGIANLAFYLMVAGGPHPRGKTTVVVPALDSNPSTSLQKGAAIFYRANTVYLTPGSNFSDAYAQTVQAAKDLYGASSSAVASVQAAWDAVGVPRPATWTAISTQSGLSASRNGQTSFTQVTPAGAKRLKFELSGSSGDADLYVKFGSAPTTGSYTCASESATSNEVCEINPAQAGTYYVMINAYAAYSGLTYKVSSTTE